VIDYYNVTKNDIDDAISLCWFLRHQQSIYKHSIYKRYYTRATIRCNKE